MFLKGMLITNQLLYQLSYKGMSRFINDKSYFAILNKSLCLQRLLQLFANSAVKLPVVTDISYSNRTRYPIWFGISKVVPFLTKVQNNKRNEYDTKKKKTMKRRKLSMKKSQKNFIAINQLIIS